MSSYNRTLAAWQPALTSSASVSLAGAVVIDRKPGPVIGCCLPQFAGPFVVGAVPVQRCHPPRPSASPPEAIPDVAGWPVIM